MSIWADLSNPFSSERHLLRTRLRPSECEARLDALFDVDPYKKIGRPRGPVEQYPLWGEAWSHCFAVSKRRAFNYNPWRTIAYGQFHPTSDGTNISLRLSQSTAITCIEIGFVLVPPLLMALDVVVRPSPSYPVAVQASMGFIFVLLMVLVPIGILHWVGRRMARGEGDWLLGFLEDTLEAQEVTQPVEGSGHRYRQVASY